MRSQTATSAGATLKRFNSATIKRFRFGENTSDLAFQPAHGATYLGEVEESRLTEQDVSQEHRAAGQYLNLVFTVMMAPQELTKVPASERARRTDESGSVGGKKEES